MTSNSRRTGALAIVAVALAAGGAALAATKVHGSSGSTSAGGFGPPGAAPGVGSSDSGFRDGGPGPGFRGGGPHGGGLSAASDYLGLSGSELFARLQSGKTLAQIASSTPGKSTQGLVDAMVAAERQELQSAVSSGRLSQAQADQIAADVTSRVTAMVNGSFPGRRGGGYPQVPGVTL